MGCGRRGAWLCVACSAQLQPVTLPVCYRCGRPWAGSKPCPQCHDSASALQGLRAAFCFEGPLRQGVHRLKYRRAGALAAPLAELMLPAYDGLPWTPEVLVPVPLHPARQRQRGYNQAALLARELARQRGIDVDERALRRLRDTPPQMGLGAAERRRNVAGAFAGLPGALAGRRVLLLDDVCTTGSTLEACAEGARQAGAAAVWGLVLARPR